MDRKIDVLDSGFVELIDALGSDLTVVNSARVSFGKRKEVLNQSDERLIQYLVSHQHWSPFRHVQLQFHCKVPEFVARQWYKHVVGIAYSEVPTVDHAWNEVSLRYTNASDMDVYAPDGFRQQSEDNKQASVDQQVDDSAGQLEHEYKQHCEQALALYPPPGTPRIDDLFNGSVYMRGGLTLHTLRLEMGDDRFFSFVETWATSHRYGNAGTGDFLDLVEELADSATRNLAEEWLFNPVLPAIEEMDLRPPR